MFSKHEKQFLMYNLLQVLVKSVKSDGLSHCSAWAGQVEEQLENIPDDGEIRFNLSITIKNECIKNLMEKYNDDLIKEAEPFLKKFETK